MEKRHAPFVSELDSSRVCQYVINDALYVSLCEIVDFIRSNVDIDVPDVDVGRVIGVDYGAVSGVVGIGNILVTFCVHRSAGDTGATQFVQISFVASFPHVLTGRTLILQGSIANRRVTIQRFQNGETPVTFGAVVCCRGVRHFCCIRTLGLTSFLFGFVAIEVIQSISGVVANQELFLYQLALS